MALQKKNLLVFLVAALSLLCALPAQAEPRWQEHGRSHKSKNWNDRSYYGWNHYKPNAYKPYRYDNVRVVRTNPQIIIIQRGKSLVNNKGYSLNPPPGQPLHCNYYGCYARR